jgi:hypothetical protein
MRRCEYFCRGLGYFLCPLISERTKLVIEASIFSLLLEPVFFNSIDPKPEVHHLGLNFRKASETGRLLNIIWPIFSVVLIHSTDNLMSAAKKVCNLPLRGVLTVTLKANSYPEK